MTTPLAHTHPGDTVYGQVGDATVPLRFSDLPAEYTVLRDRAVALDLGGHTLIEISGPGAVDFAQRGAGPRRRVPDLRALHDEPGAGRRRAGRRPGPGVRPGGRAAAGELGRGGHPPAGAPAGRRRRGRGDRRPLRRPDRDRPRRAVRVGGGRPPDRRRAGLAALRGGVGHRVERRRDHLRPDRVHRRVRLPDDRADRVRRRPVAGHAGARHPPGRRRWSWPCWRCASPFPGWRRPATST